MDTIESASACMPIGLKVTLTDGRVHRLLVSASACQQIQSDEHLSTDCFAVVSESDSGTDKILMAVGGTEVQLSDRRIQVPETLVGRVTAVDYQDRKVTVSFPKSRPRAETLIGRYVRVFSDQHSCMRRISSVRKGLSKYEIGFEDCDLLIGRVKVTEFDPSGQSFTSQTGLPWGDQLLGTTVVTETRERLGRLQAREDTVFHLDTAAKVKDIQDSDGTGAVELYFGEIGVGDRVEIEGAMEE
ncbi:MAG TPA: hypothetical protein PKH07_15420, partial [bacterium]|nr:hypothetical protein [bacterium]